MYWYIAGIPIHERVIPIVNVYLRDSFLLTTISYVFAAIYRDAILRDLSDLSGRNVNLGYVWFGHDSWFAVP